MRAITIPPAVKLVKRTDPDGTKVEEDKGFLAWLSDHLFSVKSFRVGGKGLRRWAKVDEEIEKVRKGPSNVLRLEDADWEAIKESFGEAEWVTKSVLPFLTAIEQAPEEK